MKDFSQLFETVSLEREKILESYSVVNKESHFYHITSHSFNDENIYNFSTATYRHNLLYNLCQTHNCVLLLDVIKPTHSHELLMCRNFEDLTPIMRNLNSKVSRLIRENKQKKYSITGMHVFRDAPSYTAITNHVHLLYLVKYFWSNCQELIQRGKQMPYNCFEQINSGFSKSYNIPLLEELFQMQFPEVIKLCSNLSNEDFMQFCKQKYSEISQEEEKKLFLI